MNITALHNRVFIQPITADQSAGGILLPETAKQEPMLGRVFSAGPGTTRRGKFVATEVKEGDIVIFPRNAGERTKTEDRGEIVILMNEDILAVVVQDA